MIEMHDRCALRNSGAAGSMPLPPKMSPNPPPEAEDGSGKFGTPCARMHLENLSCVTSAPARCAGLGAPPTNLTPPLLLDLDEDAWRAVVLGPGMLATVRLEPPPQPAMRTATAASTTRAARAHRPARSAWRALTVSVGRMVNGSFASTFSTYIRGRLNLVTATPRITDRPQAPRQPRGGRHATAPA